jgi:lipid-binding SYLF domain-containing protein
MGSQFILRILFAILLQWTLSACSTLAPEELAQTRVELAAISNLIIDRTIERYPEAEAELAAGVGFFAGQLTGANVVVAGAGTGLGELHDNRDGSISYIDIRRLDLGAGLGASRSSVLIVFKQTEALDNFRSGQFLPTVNAESSFGESGTGRAASFKGEGLSSYYLAEQGAGAVLTTRVLKTRINEDLTDTGVSHVSVPNTGFERRGEQEENVPRRWDRPLPFLAQRVIDLGYDLPLPFGLRLNYAGVDQDMFLSDLDVGFNGGAKETFEFVDFSDASADSDSVQLILDAWIFPFMNVSLLVGELDGVAPMDIFLDGNGMLDQLGEDCSAPGLNPLCRLLADKTFVLPIEADFSGTTYGIGMMFAGGWQDYFVTIPFNFTYADMDTTETDGIAYTVTPRVGRSFELGQAGTVSAYIGGNYLKAELDVTGSVDVPGVDLSIDYNIQQKNADRWNALIGANWDISRRWSWSAEYNGFTGSREAFITSVNYRF